MHSDAPIGVFDSGVGGLSVLQALRAELPQERFVYLGDGGHAPYGERDDTHVLARSHAITRYLLATHHIKALVVACNTATAAAVHVLRQDFPTLPIVGIEPALKPAAQLSRTQRIGVLATRGTLGSEKFATLLASLAQQAQFLLQPCDGLADAIERDDTIKIRALCAEFTRPMAPFGIEIGAVDTLVLGCTHYPFVEPVLRQCVGAAVRILECGAPVARQTRRLLAERDALASHDLPAPAFYYTGTPQVLSDAVRRWLQLDSPVHAIALPSVAA